MRREDFEEPVKGIGKGIHCYYRDSYAFFGDGKVFNHLIIRYPSDADLVWSSQLYGEPQRSYEENLKLIQDLQLEKAIIIAESIEFITQCPSLKEVVILPASSAQDHFDYSPLYDMPYLRRLGCPTEYGEEVGKKNTTVIDLSRIYGLEKLSIAFRGQKNYTKIPTLKDLSLTNCKWHQDLKDVCRETDLHQLSIWTSSIKTLDGIEQAKNIESVDLEMLRSLTDASALEKIGSSLKVLVINTCPKLKDFSFLHSLPNLERMVLVGNQEIPDLSFLDNMPKLECLTFMMNALDGDLTRCLKIPYASCKNRRHYNLKSDQLPKGDSKYVSR